MVKKSSELSRREQPRRAKPGVTMLTEKMMKELKALQQRKVDLSDEDAPEIVNWENSEVGKFYRPLKKQITIRIDADVLEWFKHATNKYQTLINLACREYMMCHTKLRRRVKHKNE
ncbi:MAG: BrnA antitoxin family protein [Gammaproteobacteria bacterium]